MKHKTIFECKNIKKLNSIILFKIVNIGTQLKSATKKHLQNFELDVFQQENSAFYRNIMKKTSHNFAAVSNAIRKKCIKTDRKAQCD